MVAAVFLASVLAGETVACLVTGRSVGWLVPIVVKW